MIDFVGTPPFLKMALQVAMVTSHFHIAPTGLFLGTFFSHSGVPGNNLAPMINCPWGAGWVKIGPGVIEISTNFKKDCKCKMGFIVSLLRTFLRCNTAFDIGQT